MSKIKTYPVVQPELSDLLIGTYVEEDNATKNFMISDILALGGTGVYVPYVGATLDVNLGSNTITSGSFIRLGGTSSEFLKADGSVDSNTYVSTSYLSAAYVPYVGASSNVNINTNSVIANDGVYTTEMSPSYFNVKNNASTKFGVLHYDKLQVVDITVSKTMELNPLGLKFPDGTFQTTAATSVSGSALTSVNDTNVTLTLGGSPSTSLLAATSLTLGWTGTLADSRIASASLWNIAYNNRIASLTTTGTGAATLISNVLNIPTPPTATFTSLTTTGSSGPSSLLSGVLNVPTYTLSGLGGEPAITPGTTSQYWRGDKTWQTFPTIPTVGTWGELNYPTWVSGTPFVKMTAAGTFALDTNTYLTSAVTSVGATGPITSSGGTTPTISTSMSTNKLIGRSTAGTGVMEEITIGSGLSLSSGTLSASGSSGTIPHTTASGTDTYTATIAGVTSYNDGDGYLVRFTNGNTSGATLNINSLGAITLYRNNDGVLIGGDIQSGAEMLCVYNSTLNAFQCIGTSPNTLLAYVTNDDSVTLTKGMPVYAFSGTGDRMTVKRAYNTSDATSAQTVGLVLSSSIAANQKGFIIVQGLLDGLSILPTSTWSDGDPVYLGATAGTLTNVKPYAPNHLVYLGVVTTASPGSSGRMYVRVQNGYELDELHNVQAQTPTYKDTLWYDNTVSPAQWKTASISTILGYTPQAALSGTGIVKSTSGTISYITDNSTNWDTAYTDRLKWDGGSTGLVAATGRTSLGATTVGGNLFTLTNPSAITFPRINADNTVSTLDAATFRTAISAVGVVTKTTVDGTNITGTTGETLTGTLTIPANTFTTGDIIRIEVFFEFTGTTGTKTCRMYANTSASLSGASLLGTTAAAAATTRSIGVDSLMAVKSATNTRLRSVSGQTYTFTGITANAPTSVNINWTTTQYIVFSIQLGGGSDSGFISFASIEKL